MAKLPTRPVEYTFFYGELAHDPKYVHTDANTVFTIAADHTDALFKANPTEQWESIYTHLISTMETITDTYTSPEAAEAAEIVIGFCRDEIELVRAYLAERSAPKTGLTPETALLSSTRFFS